MYMGGNEAQSLKAIGFGGRLTLIHILAVLYVSLASYFVLLWFVFLSVEGRS